jgi:predicted GIY-YIG superfamily endonuclease
MYYVYLLRSINYSDRTYVDYTANLEERLAKHNAGGSIYTADYKPWKIVACIGFDEECKAIEFEKYIKSGSGYAFAKKRLW